MPLMPAFISCPFDDQWNAHLVLARAAVVADVEVARFARDPILDGIALAHHEGDVADPLRETRVRYAGAEPALLDELGARQHIGALAQPFFGLLHEARFFIHVAIHDPAFTA